MEQIKVLFDREANTLTVWFSDPQKEYECEETGEEVVLMKDAAGRVIGFEKLYVHKVLNIPSDTPLPFEVVVT